jgi:hypothetical protein
MAYGWRKIFVGAREKKYAPLECPPVLHLPHSTSPSTPQLNIITHALMIYFPQHSELAREKMWSRIYLTPLLQAEEDRDQARRHFADQAREKELFGTQTSAYNSDRYVSSSRLPEKNRFRSSYLNRRRAPAVYTVLVELRLTCFAF